MGPYHSSSICKKKESDDGQTENCTVSSTTLSLTTIDVTQTRAARDLLWVQIQTNMRTKDGANSWRSTWCLFSSRSSQKGRRYGEPRSWGKPSHAAPAYQPTAGARRPSSLTSPAPHRPVGAGVGGAPPVPPYRAHSGDTSAPPRPAVGSGYASCPKRAGARTRAGDSRLDTATPPVCPPPPALSQPPPPKRPSETHQNTRKGQSNGIYMKRPT